MACASTSLALGSPSLNAPQECRRIYKCSVSTSHPLSSSPSTHKNFARRITRVATISASGEEGIPSTPARFAKQVGTTLSATALAAATMLLPLGMTPFVFPTEPVLAVLNRFEAETRGEFGIGSAAQYGSADLRKTDHANENFRRANFTSADMREADFHGSIFTGGYLEKAVAYRTNFEGADFTDALMDRMTLNEANLKDAILVRTVLTRSDLGGAIVEGADFSDSVIDLSQKQALCKYAKGENPVTGMSTRTSLGCSNKRGNAYGTPSAPVLSGPPTILLDKNGFCNAESGLCDLTP